MPWRAGIVLAHSSSKGPTDASLGPLLVAHLRHSAVESRAAPDRRKRKPDANLRADALPVRFGQTAPRWASGRAQLRFAAGSDRPPLSVRPLLRVGPVSPTCSWAG